MTIEALQAAIREREQRIRSFVLEHLSTRDVAYSREVMDAMPKDQGSIVSMSCPIIGREMQAMERDGLLTSYLVPAGTLPKQSTIRRYYRLVRT